MGRRLLVCGLLVLPMVLGGAESARAASTVELVQPAIGAHVSGTQPLEATVAAGVTVSDVAFFIDGRRFSTPEAAPYQAVWDATEATTGAHEIKVRATLSNGSYVSDRAEVVVGEPLQPLWSGDFSTGDLSQWGGAFGAVYSVGGDRLQVGEAPGRTGYAARFEVRPGDRPTDAGGDRNEVAYTDRAVNGVRVGDGARYYAWDVFIPSDYLGHVGYQTITQWHQAQISGPSPLKVMLTEGSQNFKLRYKRTPTTAEKTLAMAPATRGAWHHWVVGVNWAGNTGEGWIEAYLNGRKVFTRTPLVTQYLLAGSGPVFNHLKQGLYRDSAVDVDQAVYLRGTQVGLTLASVGGAEGWPDGLAPQPTPSPTATPAPTLTPAATPEPTATPEPEPTTTPEPTPDPTPEPTPDPTPEPTPAPTPEPTPAATPMPTPTPEPELTPTPAPEATATPAPTSAPAPIPGVTTDLCYGKPPTLTASGVATGTDGDDVIITGNRADVVDGLGGHDLICTRGGDDHVRGGSGNDKVSLGNDDDVADGQAGSDNIQGTGGGDAIRGGDGNDVLNGGAGVLDFCDGGAGIDFVAPAGGCESMLDVP